MVRKTELALNEMALEPAERLAKLLKLSYEPMLAWRLDGPIEFWNAGAERLYGFTRDEAVGRSSHVYYRQNFRSILLSCACSCGMGSLGWASCDTSAKMVAKSSSRAVCSCSMTARC